MKNVIKIALIYLYSIFNNNKKGKIIYYHDVFQDNKYTSMGTHIKLFEKHINIIRKNGFIIVNHLPQNSKEINICLDDGWCGIWDVKDFFLENNILPTIFIAVDLIGKDGYLSLEQILLLHKFGFNFQSHTFHHLDLTSLSIEESLFELTESKNILSNLLNKNIDSICFPMGFFSDRLLKMCSDVGYNYIYSSIPGYYSDDNFYICRNLVQNTPSYLFKYILFGGLDILKTHTLKIHFKNIIKESINIFIL